MAGELTQEILSVVRARLDDLSGERWTDSELLAGVNAGFLELAHRLPDAALPWLTEEASESLVQGQDAYDLPADLLRERQVLYKGIIAVRWRVAETRALLSDYIVKNTASEARPFYRIFGGQIIFSVGGVTQTTGAKYTVRYIRVPREVSLTVDPDLPAPFWNAVEDYVVADCLAEAGQTQLAALHRAHFTEFCKLVTYQWQNPHLVYDGLPADMALQEA